MRSSAHEFQQASRGGLRSVRINISFARRSVSCAPVQNQVIAPFLLRRDLCRTCADKTLHDTDFCNSVTSEPDFLMTFGHRFFCIRQVGFLAEEKAPCSRPTCSDIHQMGVKELFVWKLTRISIKSTPAEESNACSLQLFLAAAGIQPTFWRANLFSSDLKSCVECSEEAERCAHAARCRIFRRTSLARCFC